MTNPRVLLLRAPIEYQRVENKFSSLEPQILQVKLLFLVLVLLGSLQVFKLASEYGTKLKTV